MASSHSTAHYTKMLWHAWAVAWQPWLIQIVTPFTLSAVFLTVLYPIVNYNRLVVVVVVVRVDQVTTICTYSWTLSVRTCPLTSPDPMTWEYAQMEIAHARGFTALETSGLTKGSITRGFRRYIDVSTKVNVLLLILSTLLFRIIYCQCYCNTVSVWQIKDE